MAATNASEATLVDRAVSVRPRVYRVVATDSYVAPEAQVHVLDSDVDEDLKGFDMWGELPHYKNSFLSEVSWKGEYAPTTCKRITKVDNKRGSWVQDSGNWDWNSGFP